MAEDTMKILGNGNESGRGREVGIGKGKENESVNEIGKGKGSENEKGTEKGNERSWRWESCRRTGRKVGS